MAAKTQLKDRVTGEELYPVITKDCIPGTEIITTDNVPVIPYDEDYGPAFFEQRIIPIGKFATGHSDANKVGFGFEIDNTTDVYKPESDIYEYGCSIVYDNPNEFIHNYKVPVTNDVNDYTGALNLTTARYVQKLINNIPNATTDKAGLMSTEQVAQFELMKKYIDGIVVNLTPVIDEVKVSYSGSLWEETYSNNVWFSDGPVPTVNVTAYQGNTPVSKYYLVARLLTTSGTEIKNIIGQYNTFEDIKLTALKPENYGQYRLYIHAQVKTALYEGNTLMDSVEKEFLFNYGVSTDGGDSS